MRRVGVDGGLLGDAQRAARLATGAGLVCSSLVHASSARNTAAVAIDVRRKSRLDIPRRRAWRSIRSRARRSASRSTGDCGGGTYSPLETGPSSTGELVVVAVRSLLHARAARVLSPCAPLVRDSIAACSSSCASPPARIVGSSPNLQASRARSGSDELDHDRSSSARMLAMRAMTWSGVSSLRSLASRSRPALPRRARADAERRQRVRATLSGMLTTARRKCRRRESVSAPRDPARTRRIASTRRRERALRRRMPLTSWSARPAG